MDTNQSDDAKTQGAVTPPISQQPAPPVQDDTSQVQPGDDQKAPVQQPPSVTPRGKEAAPIKVQGEVQDFVEPTAHEVSPQLPREVERAGVEASQQPQDVKLNEEQKAVGIQAAKESTPMPTDSQGVVASSPWPITKAVQQASGKADDSSTWLGKLVLFVFGQQQHKKDTV